MSNRKSKSKSLSDKICDALKAPELLDPEDDICEDTKAKTVQVDSDIDDNDNLEATLSSFRKQNAKLLQDIDKKYAGKAVSRKSLNKFEDESDSNEEISVGSFVRKPDSDSNVESTDGESSHDEISDGDENLQNSFDVEPNESTDDSKSFEYDSEASDNSEVSEDDSMNDFDDINISDIQNNSTKDESNFKHVNDSNASEGIKKGNAVCQQLHIWEKLMEMRIHSQKLLLNSNKLPRYDEYPKFVAQTNTDFKEKVQESKKLLTNLLNKYLDAQQLLLNKYPETKDLLKDKEDMKSNDDMDEEIPSDTEDEIESDSEDGTPSKRRKVTDFPKTILETHEKYIKYAHDVIQKWHDKVRVASGIMNHKNLGTSSLIQHIQHILYDKDRLRKRTQLKRSNYHILSLKSSVNEIDNKKDETTNDIEEKKIEEEYNSEIFDDDDFYHQLLRELIEYKTANVTDPVQLSKQWIELQQLRNKMKRKIDTKATKGRRIRYSVHPKLVNFMAPEENSMWTDEAKDELFGSVFGKKIQQKG